MTDSDAVRFQKENGGCLRDIGKLIEAGATQNKGTRSWTFRDGSVLIVQEAGGSTPFVLRLPEEY